MSGEVGILNVGCGDTKLTFDKNDPAECIRAARIVTDMLCRGYALLVEVESGGTKTYRRVTKFEEATCEYVIADFDPVQAEIADNEPPTETSSPTPSQKGKLRPRRKLAASEHKAVAVARTAGG